MEDMRVWVGEGDGGRVGELARLRRRDDVDIVCTTGGFGTPGGVEGMGAGCVCYQRAILPAMPKSREAVATPSA